MRQIRQMLRLARDGVSAREIGHTLGAARSTIQDNLDRAKAAGLSWPLPGDLTEDMLEQRLFARAGARRGFRRRSEPDWASLACELKRPGVNCLGVLRLFKDFGPRHAETIAAEAVARGALTYKSIAAIVAARRDRHPPTPDTVVVDHPNLRGPGYFH